MNRTIGRLAALLLALGLVGCNAFGPSGEDEQNEVRVTVLALGSDYLDADDGFRYEVDADTQYEGFSGNTFADITLNAVVQIEYEEISTSSRRALEIEADGAEDGD